MDVVAHTACRDIVVYADAVGIDTRGLRSDQTGQTSDYGNSQSAPSSLQYDFELSAVFAEPPEDLIKYVVHREVWVPTGRRRYRGIVCDVIWSTGFVSG
jgi:hypothetical protein